MSNNNPAINNQKVKNPETDIEGEIKVSVIMPIYNGEKILDLYLPQVLNQSLKAVNFFLVNDGSNDKTLEILKKYEKTDSRIKVLTQENGGAGSARNLGLNYLKEHPELRGQYLWFPDLGDDFDPEFLLKMWTNAKINQSDMVITPYLYESQKKHTYARRYNLNYKKLFFEYPFSFQSRDLKDFVKIATTSPWDKLYSAEIVFQNNLLFDQIETQEDATFNLLNYLLSQKISYLEDSLIYYNTSIEQIRADIHRQNHKKYNLFLTSLEKNLEGKTAQNFEPNIALKNKSDIISLSSSFGKTISCIAKSLDSFQKKLKDLNLWEQGKYLLQTRLILQTSWTFYFLEPESYPEFFELFELYCQKLEVTKEWAENNEALNDKQRQIFELAKKFNQEVKK